MPIAMQIQHRDSEPQPKKIKSNLGVSLLNKILRMSTHQPTLGNGKICYIEIPASDLKRSAEFYKKVFGWKIRTHSDGHLAFDDGVGQVSGTWRLDRLPMTEVTILTHIMVDDIEKTITAVVENGGKIVRPIGMDPPEITAWFSDPAGNIFGLYQEPEQSGG